MKEGKEEGKKERKKRTGRKKKEGKEEKRKGKEVPILETKLGSQRRDCIDFAF